MSTKAKPDNRHPGRAGNNISLHPMTGDLALAAALQVKPADLKCLEEEEAQAKNASTEKKK